MPIAIKALEEEDKIAFSDFLKTPRRELPDLKFAPLAAPHEEIAIVVLKKEKKDLITFSNKYNLTLHEYGDQTVALSKSSPFSLDNKKNSYIFSGYIFTEGKMFIGPDEVSENIKDPQCLCEKNGEYSLCIVDENGNIQLSSDFFGMVPWFYFDNDFVFAASNNYHLLLLLLKEIGVSLTMNIPRSRVNMITTGFTYGSSFSKELDVSGCRMNFAYEKINFSLKDGLSVSHTSLRDILTDKQPWNEDKYEEYLNKAKSELEENCREAFEHPRFKKIVVDISGGFDSRVVFATACNLPKHLRKKMYTHTRQSGTEDDIEKADAVTNLYNYPKHTYARHDTSELFDGNNNEINLAHISRTLGTYSVSSYLYSCRYDNIDTLEITGYLGEVILGYMRCRGEVDYSLGDRRLLARLGGCYLWNSVTELNEVFEDQAKIINDTLSNYKHCDCLFKKFQQLYIDSRNRFICGSAHNIENNNLRIPMLFSQYALRAKWLYFNKFSDNEVPDEKVSIDLLNKINPLLTALPFTKNNDNVMPKPENLLNPVKVTVNIDSNAKQLPKPEKSNSKNLYYNKLIEYIDNLEVAEQMLLQIYDYSEEYYPVCLGLYKVIRILKTQPDEIKTSHARETIRKIYDVYYQMHVIKR